MWTCLSTFQKILAQLIGLLYASYKNVKARQKHSHTQNKFRIGPCPRKYPNGSEL